jgi:ferrous-iron efflux pump FieF
MMKNHGPSTRVANGTPHAPNVSDRKRVRMMRRATAASVFVAALLVIVKTIAYLGTGSVSMLGALTDSAADLVASLGVMFAVGHALTPADQQHRFGHGKAEPLTGLAQAVFIAGSATFVVTESVRHLLAPEAVTAPFLGMIVILFSMSATFALLLYQQKVVRTTGSLAIASDRAHYAGDLLTNFGVIVAIILSSLLGWHIADPIIGLAIAGVLYLSSWWVFRRSLDQLMDRELPEEDRERVKAIVLNHAQVRGLHDLRTRAAGTQSFIQVHVEMDANLNLYEAHDVSDEIEQSLRAAFPRAEILIHIDPHGQENPSDLARS